MKTRILVVASVVCICALIAVGQSKKKPSPSPTPASTWDSYGEDDHRTDPGVELDPVYVLVRLHADFDEHFWVDAFDHSGGCGDGDSRSAHGHHVLSRSQATLSD